MNPSRERKSISFVTWSVIALLTTFSIGIYIGKNDRPVDKVTSLENKEMTDSVKVDFSPFWRAWNLLDEKFVTSGTTTSAQERVWGAISGMTESLGDPFTVFMPPENAKAFDSEISGSFEGIGMEIAVKNNALTVITPLKNTPAEKSGIMPGDRILKINDTSTTNMQADQAVKLIRGKKGTVVKLLFERDGKKDSFEVKVIRDTIQIPTIDTEIKNGTGVSAGDGADVKDGVHIIRLYSFSEPSSYLFGQAIRKFAKSGSNKLIIDLRGNPGGYLDSAVEIASWFLPLGKTVVTEEFGNSKTEKVHRSIGYENNFPADLKIVILVNGGSASASEIFAGALQEYGVAKLVGTQTFGKGSVQELIKLTPETSLKVTIAKWLTPKGRSISAGGLTPDEIVEITAEDREKGKDPQMQKALEILNKK